MSSQDGGLNQCPHGQAAVVPAETEAVGEDPAHPCLACLVRHVVQIASGIGRLVVDGGVDQAVLDGQGANDQLYATAGPERVTKHALGAAHGESAGVIAEDLLDGLRLCFVTQRGAGPVSIDVLDVLGI